MTKRISLGIAAFIAVVLLFRSFTIVSPGYRGLVIRLGSVRGVYAEGIHLKLPLIDSVKKIDVRASKSEIEVGAASKDLQDVRTTVAVTRRIDPSYLAEVYQTVGYGDGVFTDKIVNPAVQESVKAATAQFTAEELVTKRQAVKERIQATLAERLAKYHSVLDDVSIVNFSFSDSFNAAIEAKVTAEQNALAAKNKLEQVKFEAQQKIETAKADAESIRIQAQALAQNQELVKLKAVEKWNGVLPTTMLPNGSVPFLDLK